MHIIDVIHKRTICYLQESLNFVKILKLLAQQYQDKNRRLSYTH